MTHSVKLDVFEGPIDLLLQLITRQRVDIYEVSLATVAREFVDALAAMEDLDLESATGFLVVAATLLELKSTRLLPARELPDDDNAAFVEERDLLLARLVECATYRAAGEWIAGGLEAGAAMHPRTAELDPTLAGLEPDPLERTSLSDLADAAARVLQAPAPAPLDLDHIAPTTASVRDAIRSIALQLQGAPERTLRSLCPPSAGRIDVVVHLLALLELFKAGAIELGQAERFGDIQARWTGECSADDVIAAADDYALEEART